MEKGNFLNGRFSLSASNLSGAPVAESTHISHSQQKFPWGGCSGGLNTSEKYIENDFAKRTIVFSKSDLRQKNDLRTYTDIQSKGITSRIVKYHGNNSRLNSSLSMNNLYNKPGQFPVVHLKKQKDISYNLNKKNLSMIRIAPPEKSVFQANTRSTILRTGSIVSTIGFQKSGDEISRENRPILHPAVENEIAPTRSVLDDLKEISRKRINSDVLDSNDSLKKYCKETELSTAASPILQQTSVPTSLYAIVPFKRQREIPLSTVGAQKSPEQLGIKRRMYSDSNNDITSSLSSSLSILSPKLKCSSTSTKISVPDLQLSPRNTQKLNSATYTLKLNNYSNFEQNVSLTTTENYENCGNGKPLRSISEPIFSAQINNKPKLTLFNKNYETAISKEHIQNLKNNTREEFSGICFVKPKANTLDSKNIGLSENSLIARTQKSKLAIMLSGLSGDLNTNEEDDIDSVSNINKETVNFSKSHSSNYVATLNSTQTTLTFGTSTTVATKIISSPTTVNSNVNKIFEKTNLPAETIQDPPKGNISSTMNLSKNIIGPSDVIKTAELTKSVDKSILNKKEINNHIPIDSTNKFHYSINNVSEASKNIFESNNVSSLLQTNLSDQLTNTTSVGIENKISHPTYVSGTKNTFNINESQNNLLPEKNVSTLSNISNKATYSNSNDGINNTFTNSPKTQIFTSLNFKDNNATNTFNATLAVIEPNKGLNKIVSQNSFTDFTKLATINPFPIAPLQTFFTHPDTSTKVEKYNSFEPDNSNRKEDTFVKFVSDDSLVPNLTTVKSLGRDSNMENKILPNMITENEFLATSKNVNLSEGGFSFKPVSTVVQQNDNTNIFGHSNTNNITMFSFESKLKEGQGVLSGSANRTKQQSYGECTTNAPFSIDKGFTFDEKKTIAVPHNIEESNKIDFTSKSSTFSFGNKVPHANQFSVDIINNTDATKINTPFSFKGNDSQSTNTTLNNTTNYQPFSFGSNSNPQKETSFNCYGKGDQNLSNSDFHKSDVTVNPPITNLFNTVSSSATNDRLIRKATRRLHK